MHILRICDRNQKLVAFDRVGNCADALEDMERDELRGIRRDTCLDDVDDRKVVPGGDRAGDAHSFGKSLLD